MAFTENLDDFLPADGPGVVTATYKGGQVNGIHERQFLAQMGVQTSAPTFLGKKSDFPAVAQGETITIGATNFKVAIFENDPVNLPDWILIQLQL